MAVVGGQEAPVDPEPLLPTALLNNLDNPIVDKVDVPMDLQDCILCSAIGQLNAVLVDLHPLTDVLQQSAYLILGRGIVTRVCSFIFSWSWTMGLKGK